MEPTTTFTNDELRGYGLPPDAKVFPLEHIKSKMNTDGLSYFQRVVMGASGCVVKLWKGEKEKPETADCFEYRMDAGNDLFLVKPSSDRAWHYSWNLNDELDAYVHVNPNSTTCRIPMGKKEPIPAVPFDRPRETKHVLVSNLQSSPLFKLLQDPLHLRESSNDNPLLPLFFGTRPKGSKDCEFCIESNVRDSYAKYKDAGAMDMEEESSSKFEQPRGPNDLNMHISAFLEALGFMSLGTVRSAS